MTHKISLMPNEAEITAPCGCKLSSYHGALFTYCTTHRAAPALLEALELAQATIERLRVDHGGFSSVDGTLNIARNAIALAKGEEVTT